MTYRGDLERAVALITLDGWHCPYCGNGRVSLFTDPLTGEPIPDSAHFAGAGPADSCPVLMGGLAAWTVHNALWTALERWLAAPDYGAESWAHSELVPA